MSALVESQSLEAEIADCCQAIYSAETPDVAMSNWVRLHELKARRTEEEDRLFLLEGMKFAIGVDSVASSPALIDGVNSLQLRQSARAAET